MTCPECGADLRGRGTLVPDATPVARRPSTVARLITWTALFLVYLPFGLVVVLPFSPCWVEVHMDGGPSGNPIPIQVGVSMETDFTGLHPLPLSPRRTYIEVSNTPLRRRRMLINPATSAYEYLDSSNRYVVRDGGLNQSVLLDLLACVGIDPKTPDAALAADSLLRDIHAWQTASYMTLRAQGRTYPSASISFIILWVVVWVAGIVFYVRRRSRARRDSISRGETVLA